MSVYYLSAAQLIREKPFEVMAPEYYHPNIDSSQALGKAPVKERVNHLRMVPVTFLNPSPFRMFVDADRPQRCAYPIEVMLDMFRKKVPFTIVHDKDVVEIFDSLDRYLLTLQADVAAGVDYIVAYARLVVSWREEVYKHYFRYMKTHPAAMDELYPNNNAKDNIFTLLSLVTGADHNQYSRDPLLARRNPPYVIDKLVPVDTSQTGTSEAEFGSSLGLSNEKPVDAGVGKFDFEDFVRG